MDTEKELEKAVEANAKSASISSIDSNDALKYTQAALNAANAFLTLKTKPNDHATAVSVERSPVWLIKCSKTSRFIGYYDAGIRWGDVRFAMRFSRTIDAMNAIKAMFVAQLDAGTEIITTEHIFDD